MSVLLKRCWAMLAPCKEESLPLISTQYDDLEACENSTDCIMLVCEIPEVSAHAAHAHTQHVRVSPFSEDHPPGCQQA